MSFWLKIDESDGAYFDIQGASRVASVVSMSFQADGLGNFSIVDSDGEEVGAGRYRSEEWVKATVNY